MHVGDIERCLDPLVHEQKCSTTAPDDAEGGCTGQPIAERSSDHILTLAPCNMCVHVRGCLLNGSEMQCKTAHSIGAVQEAGVIANLRSRGGNGNEEARDAVAPEDCGECSRS